MDFSGYFRLCEAALKMFEIFWSSLIFWHYYNGMGAVVNSYFALF